MLFPVVTSFFVGPERFSFYKVGLGAKGLRASAILDQKPSQTALPCSFCISICTLVGGLMGGKGEERIDYQLGTFPFAKVLSPALLAWRVTKSNRVGSAVKSSCWWQLLAILSYNPVWTDHLAPAFNDRALTCRSGDHILIRLLGSEPKSEIIDPGMLESIYLYSIERPVILFTLLAPNDHLIETNSGGRQLVCFVLMGNLLLMLAGETIRTKVCLVWGGRLAFAVVGPCDKCNQKLTHHKFLWASQMDFSHCCKEISQQSKGIAGI